VVRPPKPTPKAAAAALLARLRRLARPRKAAAYQRFFKEPVDLYGLDTPSLRVLQRDLVKQHRAHWSLRDAVRFCDLVVRDSHLEARGSGFQVVAAFAADAGPGLLVDVRRWLERSCGNWALVDNLAPSVLTPLLERHPSLIPEVVEWTSSPSLWPRRGAVVAFTTPARRGRQLAVAYRIVSRLLDDDEDLMHKAMGWLLREAGTTDRPRLERYLLSKGPRLPRTTLRYAIERFPKADRQRLMQATRRAGQPARSGVTRRRRGPCRRSQSRRRRGGRGAPRSARRLSGP